ncbi:pseudouridine synthase [Clostridium sulfidigenes]|uniref:Pseudouridine synthase n=1 Tax=Clostridium sulfidigenes TaxID=318464 RepID=A0A084JF47_9CLOT|nr:23S rRNA pseudouridine(2604) synthase RluF [Clostridium sulfidigenes]KEZ87581.1 pseudouridine synthase [Clostridium sulfidigenes]
MDNKNLLRLNKYISESGICSRREADKFIESGKVYVNGILATLGTRVSPTDTVVVDGKTIKPKSNKVYIALNKPVGITCTTETHVKGNIIDFVNYHERIFPIGRLDKPSEGLIFLTNDGDMVNKILRAGNNHEKEYVVSVDKPITKEFINAMENGIPILGTMTKQCKVRKIGKCTFNIILTQGLNRQIRRMCEYLGFKVTSLKRIRIMNVSLSNLPTGKWRYLSSEEMSTIINLTKDSIGTIQSET